MDTQVYPTADADRIRLLLIDDDINLLEITSILLDRKGYLVTPAKGSNEAITILQNNHKAFNIVITDFDMPVVNGLELAMMIKELSSDIPIILHTGKIEILDKRQLDRAGIAELVRKPYRIEELDEVIKKVVNVTLEV